MWVGKRTATKRRKKMKKLISITLLSAVAMLAAPTTPKAQNTTAPAPAATTKTPKKHVKKAKTAVKPAATATPAPSK
jgi:uncharacterized lipoprotein YajG